MHINTQKFTLSPFLRDHLWITLVIIILVIFVAVGVGVAAVGFHHHNSISFLTCLLLNAISYRFSHFSHSLSVCVSLSHRPFAFDSNSSSFYVISLFVELNTSSSKCVPSSILCITSTISKCYAKRVTIV